MDWNEIIKTHHGYQLGFARHYLFLYDVVFGLETKNAFEFGAGFSTKVILKALKTTGGKLTSCDVRSPELYGFTDKDRKEYSDTWTFIQGRSDEVLRARKIKPLDFVLHDGAHDGPTVYKDLKFIIPKMKVNSLLLVHDTVHRYTDILDGVERSLVRVDHQRVELPYGCGLSVIRITEDFGNGEINLTWKKKKTKI